METGLLGKKAFFLYPPPVLTEVVDILAKQEYEVYLARNHERLKRALPSYPNSLVFANIDDGMDDKAWADYMRSLRKDFPTVGLGVITLNDNPKLRELYLMDIQAQCGFILLKIGSAKTAEILAKTLEANEARGKRRFVRALCPEGTGLCAVEYQGYTLRAQLSDISSAGMAFVIDGSMRLKVGTVLHDMAMSVKGQRLMASGVVVAMRGGENGQPTIHVVMFDPNSLDDARRERLKSIVFKLNQAAMELVLNRPA